MLFAINGFFCTDTMMTFLKCETLQLMIWVRCSRFSYTLCAALWSLALASGMPVAAANIDLSSNSDQRLANMVLGIISYTQWSQSVEPVHLCVIDSPHYFKVLLPLQNDPQQQVRVSLKNAKAVDLMQHCHALFFEQTPPAQQQDIINQRGVRRILTMSLNNPSCAVGSSFCISIRQNIPSFSVNLDSLKQSGVKISSKVLILSKPSSQQDE